jgi:hypothetical protein
MSTYDIRVFASWIGLWHAGDVATAAYHCKVDSSNEPAPLDGCLLLLLLFSHLSAFFGTAAA